MFDWIPSWAWYVIGVLVLREIAAVMFGWGIDDDGNAVDARDPEGGTFGKMVNWHRREVLKTTIGWRPDPINGEDGFTQDPRNAREKDGIYDTPSGSKEYHRVIRKAKR